MRQLSGHERALRRVRDPRLLFGVLLVLGSGVVGARGMAAADDTVRYWALAHDVHTGQSVAEGDLVAMDAHLPQSSSGLYLRTSAELPGRLDTLMWAVDLRAGALPTREALVAKASVRHRELPVAVAWGSAPDDIGVGDLVDVWVGPAPGERGEGAAHRVLAGARVAAVGDGNSGSGGSLMRTVVLMVDPAGLDPQEMAALTAGHVTLVRYP